jgi:hypothetical protein
MRDCAYPLSRQAQTAPCAKAGLHLAFGVAARGAGVARACPDSISRSIEYAKAKRRQCCSTASEADKVID